MLEKLSIGTRLAVGSGLMSILVVVVACSGSLGLRHVEMTTRDILLEDAHVAEEALETNASTLQLRRYEKDYFLNIGAPEKQADYLVKWTDAHQALVAHLATLERLVASREDREILRGMYADLASYTEGFDRVAAGVRSGALATPQAANIAITGYKDAIRRLEATASALGGAGDHRMRERFELLEADVSRTHREMAVTSLIAVAIAVLLGVRLSRSLLASA